MSIEVNNITKKYDNQVAVNNVSFYINKGEIVGFLGPNGAGKSSLMKMITGYNISSEGSVVVCGFDLEKDTLKAQKCIGYLPEHNPLYLEMYIKEYLNYVADLRNVSKKRVEVVIEQTGLTPEIGKKIGQLSKGYRQRVGLAQALIHDPEVLILDEPTTGLDPNQIMEIRELIKSVGKEKTVLLSTHIMQEVEAMCSRVIIIKKGDIIKDATLDELDTNTTQVIKVEFDYRIEDVFLNRLPNVSKVQNEHDNIWLVHFDTKEDMRSVLFDFAQENELKILQMQTQNKGLEDIFRDLTKG